MPNYEELIAQREELDRQIEAAQRAAKEAAIETIKRLVKQFQLTAEDCGFRHKNSGTKQKRVVPIKYSGPNGETWSGRGRVPGWLVALENQGTSREKFKIRS